MAGVQREVEIKFRMADAAAVRRKLAVAGANFEGAFREENYFCDDAKGRLRAAGRVLRLRRSTGTSAGQEGLVDRRLTYKEPLSDPQFKVRNEIDVPVGDLDGMRLVLERLGFRCRHGYDKEREIWRLDAVMVTLDTLAFGQFVELEGAPEAIAAVAARLGFDLAQGIIKSYLTLAAEAATKAAKKGGIDRR